MVVMIRLQIEKEGGVSSSSFFLNKSTYSVIFYDVFATT